jgi:hypothetical protein
MSKSGGAHVASVEELERLRSRLLVFQSEALATVGEIMEELKRTRVWLNNDMNHYWRSQVRRRELAVSEARQRQFGAELVGTRSGPHRQETRRAEAALSRAREKLRLVNVWSRRFDEDLLPLCMPLDKLENVLSSNLLHAATELTTHIKLLQDYIGSEAPPPAVAETGEGNS